MDKYQTTFETWNKVAQLYQDKFMDLDLYNDTYDLLCQAITTKNPSLLEIGCGPGNITNYLLSKRPDFQIKGIDVAPNMVKLAQQNNPAAVFEQMDCRMIDQLAEKFDAIVCGFCLPYLSKTDAAKLVKDCASLLNNNGILYLSTIEGDYARSGYQTGSTGDQTYVYYYPQDFLKELLKSCNFELTDLLQKSYPAAEESDQIHIILIAKLSTCKDVAS